MGVTPPPGTVLTVVAVAVIVIDQSKMGNWGGVMRFVSFGLNYADGKLKQTVRH